MRSGHLKNKLLIQLQTCFTIDYQLPIGFICIQLSSLQLLSGTAFTERYLVWLGWQVGPKDHQRFQSSYATILKARMTALKKRERKDKRKATDSDKKQDPKKQSSAAKPSN